MRKPKQEKKKGRKEEKMDYNEIKKLINDIGQSNVDEVNLEFPDGIKIRVKKNNQRNNKRKSNRNTRKYKTNNRTKRNNQIK